MDSTRSWSSSGVFRGVYSKGCQTGALLGAYCARMVSSDPGGVLLGAVRAPLAMAAGAVAAAMIAGATIRQSQLFRFLKKR
ncbi:MAG: hypothetical protein V8Q46_05030 [Bifidobacterium angulatum]